MNLDALNNLDNLTTGAELAAPVKKVRDFRVKPSLEGDYYKVDCLSNSYMQQFKNEGVSFGTEAGKKKAFAFGSAFHEYVLEDKTALFDTISKEEVALIKAMHARLMSSQDETVRYFMDTKGVPETDHYKKINSLWCKARVDKIIPRQGVLLELKTTSCTTPQSFKKACSAFGYNRAASFYLDVTGASKHITVAISKKRSKEGHRIFTKVVERGSDLYFKGLSEYLSIQADIIANYYED
jgi:hypothetical protein